MHTITFELSGEQFAKLERFLALMAKQHDYMPAWAIPNGVNSAAYAACLIGLDVELGWLANYEDTGITPDARDVHEAPDSDSDEPAHNGGMH